MKEARSFNQYNPLPFITENIFLCSFSGVDVKHECMSVLDTMGPFKISEFI